MIIEIVRGSENTPKTMSFRNEEELFYEEFLQASEALAEILNTTVEYNRRDKARRNITLYENNVIAFCGKRGQGKTSLMRSFTDTLDDEDHEAFKKNISHSFEQIRNTKFFVLPLIDPTVLTESDSILNVILSRLFKKVQLKEDRIGNVVKGRELMEHFQRCMDDIAAIHGKKDGIAVFDNLDQLERMGDSSDIVEHFHELIKNILCYVQMDPSKDHVVIPLDDTDLQFELAYDILEDIRKYLTIPNVVVVMATNLEQLQRIVQNRYSKYFKDGEGGIPFRDMANKYLSKLLPSKRTIHLSQFQTFCRDTDDLQLVYKNGGKDGGDIIPLSAIQKGVLELLFRKTGIIFVKPSKYLHNIFPTTMRGLAHLLSLLASMQDIPEVTVSTDAGVEYLASEDTVKQFEEQTKIALKNLQLFEDYFFHEWCADKLEPKHCEMLSKASGVTLNLRIRKLCRDIEQSLVVCEAKRNMEYNDEDCKNADGSYQQLVFFLHEIAKENVDEEIYSLCFAIHTYLTICWHKRMWKCREQGLAEWRKHSADGEKRNYFTYAPLADLLDGTLYIPCQKKENQQTQSAQTLAGGTQGTSNVKRYDCSRFIVPVSNANKAGDGVKPFLAKADDREKYLYDCTRLFFGCLTVSDANAIKNNNLYQVQAFCLMIVLNWDVQHLMYKCEDFFAQKELPLQPGTLSEAPKLSRRYLLLWENLKSHLQWETASTYYNEFSNLVNSTAFQGAFYDFQCTCEAFRVWRNENLHQFFQSRKSTYNSEGRLITTADDSKTELPVSPNAAAAGSGDGLENLLEQCKKCFPDVGECFKKIYDKSKGQQKPPIEPYKDELQAMGINGETFNAFFAMIS